MPARKPRRPRRKAARSASRDVQTGPRRERVAGAARARTSGDRRGDRLAAWVVVPALLAAILIFYPFGDTFEFNPDEGIELMKALLVSKGYALYDEIWNDQPPLFTYVLTGWLTRFGWEAFHGRCLVLLTCGVLLWSLYQIIRASWGHGHAVLAVVLLLLSAHFLPRSVSVMFVIPMHAFLLLALYGLSRYRRGTWAWPLLLSAVAMAVSVQSKFASAFLVPLFLVGIPAAAWSNRGERSLREAVIHPLVVWCGVFGLVGVAILFALMAPGSVSKVIAPHVAAGANVALKGGPKLLWDYVQQDIRFLWLAVAGALFVLSRRNWRSLLPLAWYGLAFVVLMRHRPLWQHYYLFLSIPTCWLAGIALGELFRVPRRSDWLPTGGLTGMPGPFLRWATLVLLVLLVPALPAKWSRLSAELADAEDLRDRQVATRMKARAAETKWVITDRQIVPFYAGLIVPPELSVTSLKRMYTKDVTPAKIVAALETYKPMQVFFDGSRIPLTSDILQHLRAHYRWEGKGIEYRRGGRDIPVYYFVRRSPSP